MRHTSGSFEARDGLSLFRQTWLPDTPPHAALINLHGLGDHSGLHARLVEWMVERGIGVYAYDARGNGRSGGQRAYVDRWSDYLDDLGRFVALVRAETGDVPLFLAGTSLGGLVAIDYALTHGANGLAGVIAVAPPLGRLGVPPHLLLLARILSRVWPRFSLEAGMDLGGLARDPAVADTVLNDPLFHRLGTARLSTEVESAIARVRSVDRVPVPLLLVHGGADRMVPPQGTRDFHAKLAAGDRTYIEYPGGYHALVADLGGDDVLRDMSRWIEARLS